MASVKRKII
jgi:hypothetical protein